MFTENIYDKEEINQKKKKSASGSWTLPSNVLLHIKPKQGSRNLLHGITYSE